MMFNDFCVTCQNNNACQILAECFTKRTWKKCSPNDRVNIKALQEIDPLPTWGYNAGYDLRNFIERDRLANQQLAEGSKEGVTWKNSKSSRTKTQVLNAAKRKLKKVTSVRSKKVEPIKPVDKSGKPVIYLRSTPKPWSLADWQNEPEPNFHINQ